MVQRVARCDGSCKRALYKVSSVNEWCKNCVDRYVNLSISIYKRVANQIILIQFNHYFRIPMINLKVIYYEN